MIRRKVKQVHRNKWGEINKIVGFIDLPNTVTFTPLVNGEKSTPRRISSSDIAEIDFLDCDDKLDGFKKQYKKA